MIKEIKSVWVIIDKKMWLKDKSNKRLLHDECWMSDIQAEEFAIKNYGVNYEEWVLVYLISFKINNEAKHTNVYSHKDCTFNYCPNPKICSISDECVLKKVHSQI